MYRIVLLRHGQSIWNRERRFTGWTDIELTARGEAEAQAAGRILGIEGFVFDLCYTSVLRRATETARIVLREMHQEGIPLHASWRLNERHYGALQGRSLWSAMCHHGPGPVLRCQRQFSVRPPLLSPSDPRFPGRDPAYAGICADLLPLGESLADALERVRPYWEETIVPQIRAGQRVLIVAHRNSLRALLKHLEGVPDELAPRIRIPTGVPQVCDLDDNLRMTRRFGLGRR